jgi:hypothetical protein
MTISRMQLVKELEPGLNALFGLEYDRYENQDKEIFDTESSDRAFEEEVMLGGFANASVKPEGSLAFTLTEEAVEDNLYDKLSTRYTKALARSMANTKQVKAANILNRGFNSSYLGGDNKELLATDHPTLSGDQKNELSTAADLNETSLEQALIDIADMADERGLKIALRGMKLIIPVNLQFNVERLLKSPGRPATADNDINAVKSMGMLPQGYVVNNFLTDTDAWFIKTDAPNGMKHFTRAPIRTAMEGDFDTGNVRYKARERYSFGWSDWRGVFGSPGA